MPVSKDEFRSAMSRFASGVTVITIKGEDNQPNGNRIPGNRVATECGENAHQTDVARCPHQHLERSRAGEPNQAGHDCRSQCEMNSPHGHAGIAAGQTIQLKEDSSAASDSRGHRSARNPEAREGTETKD